eukprot:CAMPEP_0197002556 /NCGR_PEP_ID=MMETSP1380-20130617/7022_1 /TAXON_ID=5936 /ORGANISM="Euplotes crassus, Strain CT5" /LENGTH=223 /DNA_ID=CAMNT_0042420725 /DNA_START=31 /DNA_END=702 /DNA_ORIENTATION=-
MKNSNLASDDLLYDSPDIQETKGFLQAHLDDHGHRVIDSSRIVNDLRDSRMNYKIVRDYNPIPKPKAQYPDFYSTVPAKPRGEGVAKFFMVTIPILIGIASVAVFVLYMTNRLKMPKFMKKFVKKVSKKLCPKKETREDHMAEINKYFEDKPRDGHDRIMRRVRYRVRRQMEDNTANHIHKCGLEESGRERTLSETKESATLIIFALFKSVIKNKKTAYGRYG